MWLCTHGNVIFRSLVCLNALSVRICGYGAKLLFPNRFSAVVAWCRTCTKPMVLFAFVFSSLAQAWTYVYVYETNWNRIVELEPQSKVVCYTGVSNWLSSSSSEWVSREPIRQLSSLVIVQKYNLTLRFLSVHAGALSRYRKELEELYGQCIFSGFEKVLISTNNKKWCKSVFHPYFPFRSVWINEIGEL